jgi:hypothetical protein
MDDFDFAMDTSFDFADLSDSESPSRPIPNESESTQVQTWDYEMDAFPVSSSRTSLKEKLVRLGGVSISSRPSTATPVVPATATDSESADWAVLGLSKPVLRAIYNVLRFERPSHVQREVIPLVLDRKDVLVTSETGSGKSAAFLVPIVELLLGSTDVSRRRLTTGAIAPSNVGKLTSGEGANSRIITGGRAVTRALVLLPTRELAVQCSSMLSSIVAFSPVTFTLVLGGAEPKTQGAELRKQQEILPQQIEHRRWISCCRQGSLYRRRVSGCRGGATFATVTR